MSNLVRYSLIKEKFPREFLLLQGTGCIYKQCAFCDYHNDVSADPFLTNKSVLEKVTGQFGVLDVINSGSCFELDENTLELIYQKALEKNIHTIWFEAHYLYRNKLVDFRKKFPQIKLKFRTGVETFNPKLRDYLNKGISKNVNVADIARYFDGVCLLTGIKGQTRDDIIKDIVLANAFFEYFSVNVFTPNSTKISPDTELIHWFKEQIYPQLKNNPKVEILLNNTDLGVGSVDQI